MKFYRAYLVNSIKKVAAYRFNSIIKMINRLIFMMVQVAIWGIVYGNDWEKIISTDYGVISLSEMVSYTVISHIMYCIIQSTSISSINNKINNGDISLYLIRPYNFKIYIFMESLGELFVSCIFQSIPLLILGGIIYNINFPNITQCLYFLISLINAYIIYFLLAFLCGLTSFWFIQTGPIEIILSGLIKIFSGVWIPMWFFSDKLLKIIDVMPFKYIYFSPISIFINKTLGNDVFNTFFIQFIWIVLLYLVIRCVWKFGEKKIMVQGG